MKVFHFIFLFFAIVLSGCESLVTTLPEDKLPKTESKLVVQSFISPQATAITVVVTESEPLFTVSNGGQNIIKNALVKLSDGTNQITIPFDSLSGLYTIAKERFPIVAGKTYTLTVSDGKRNVDASCKVPASLASIKSYVIDTTIEDYGFVVDTILNLKVKWQDIPSEANYYRVRASLNVEYSTQEFNSGNWTERRVRNRVNFRWDDTIGRNDFQSDASLDGAIFTSPTGEVTLQSASQYYDTKTNTSRTFYPRNKIINITMDLNNSDEPYYKYHRSLETSNNDNPFTEPSLVYTNINNGLGCFAAYNTATLIYTPK